MQHFIIEQSESEFYAPNSSLALVEFTLNRFAALASSLAKTVYMQDVISHGEVLKRVANPNMRQPWDSREGNYKACLPENIMKGVAK